MPCCAFAAFLFSQLVLVVTVFKRIVLSRSGASATSANAAVEWRLGAPINAARAQVRGTMLWSSGRRALTVFALAAILEVALLCGAIYGVSAHLGHAHHDRVGAASSR